LAFVLAFTFGMATARYDARRELVLDDAIAIRTADIRAQQIPGRIAAICEPYCVNTLTCV
jgi:hypothetical protein